ncbi:MAG: hypothetical protein LBU64_05955 [Planctomycetota bacterium]|jgi:hypothetical protein|nr:hypothetical protein [Planctomycetota bacterium]
MPYTGTMQGAVQTGYFAHPPKLRPGQLEFVGQPHMIDSHPVESEFIHCGRGVIKGSPISVPAVGWGSDVMPFGVKATDGSVNANTAVSLFVGVLVFDAGARNDSQGAAGKQQGDLAGILKTGFVGVKLFQDTTPGGDVFLVADGSNAVSAPAGSFVSTNLSGKAFLIPKAKWWAKYSVANSPCGILQLV